MRYKKPKITTFGLGIIFLSLLFNACIKDDFVNDMRDPEIRITTSIDTIAINTSFQLEKMFLNNVGLEEAINATWSSSDEDILAVDENGLLTALSLGTATIEVSFLNDSIDVSDSKTIVVGMETVINTASINGTINTTSSYKLTGSFELSETNNGLDLAFDNDYCASTALPGLYVYLSNNRNTVSNALELGPVEVFEGEHNYIIDNVGLNDYSFIVYFCKPFNVKVGDGEL